jgi:glutathione S-transferase
VRLIGTYFSPFARRVGAALISLGVDFEHEPLNGYADPVRIDSLNPVGRVPVLVLDDGERLVDSWVILDYIDEYVGADRALVPPSGSARRAILGAAAIATAVYEKTTAGYAEEHRPGGAGRPDLIDRYRMQALGGLTALDTLARQANGASGALSLNLATISAVVAYEYAKSTHTDLDLPSLVPALTGLAIAHADDPAFARTRL